MQTLTLYLALASHIRSLVRNVSFGFMELWKPAVSYCHNDLPSLIFSLLLLSPTLPITSQKDRLPKVLFHPLLSSTHTICKNFHLLALLTTRHPPVQKLWQIKIYSTQFRQKLTFQAHHVSVSGLVSLFTVHQMNFTFSCLILDSYSFSLLLDPMPSFSSTSWFLAKIELKSHLQEVFFSHPN